MLLANGNILFSRGLGNTQSYSSKRLSDGEKAVLFYAAAVLYAPADSVIFVDAPEIFLHPSITASLWNRLEACRPDCRFCYTTHDTEFASSRNGAPAVWVRDCDPRPVDMGLRHPASRQRPHPELYMTLIGARKPVLFIEGDSERSIDAKLYPLIFPDYNVRSLGSCNKVIEATRTFNDLYAFHKMDSCGIVDRDRRDDAEVAYLRRKRIMVPDVAEIENPPPRRHRGGHGAVARMRRPPRIAESETRRNEPLRRRTPPAGAPSHPPPREANDGIPRRLAQQRHRRVRESPPRPAPRNQRP